MNKLWMLLLSLLGFAGCDEPQEDMYGTPYAEYTVKGRVTDAAGTPIAGIEVRRSSWGSDPSFAPIRGEPTRSKPTEMCFTCRPC